MFKPNPRHAVRASFNRPFRSPSVITNYLDLTIKGVDFPLGAVCALALPLCAADPALARQTLGLGLRSVGSEVARQINPSVPELKEVSLTAYEVGYSGTFGGRTTVGARLYVNDTDNDINFVTTPGVIAAAGLPALYTSTNPPPGWPFPRPLLDLPPCAPPCSTACPRPTPS